MAKLSPWASIKVRRAFYAWLKQQARQDRRALSATLEQFIADALGKRPWEKKRA